MDLLNTEVSGTTNKLLQAILRELVSLNAGGKGKSDPVEVKQEEVKQEEEVCPKCGKPASGFKSKFAFNGHVRFCKGKP